MPCFIYAGLRSKNLNIVELYINTTELQRFKKATSIILSRVYTPKLSMSNSSIDVHFLTYIMGKSSFLVS